MGQYSSASRVRNSTGVVGRIDEVPHSPRAADRDRLGRIEPLPDMSDARVVADASFGRDTAIFERRAKVKQLTT